MSRKLSKVLATAAVATAVVFGFAGAQQSEAANAAQLREQVNRGTVGIVAGDMHSATVRMSKDLATILDDGDNRRVLTVVGKGSVQNILDLLYLRHIDVAIVQADVLEYFKARSVHPDVENAIRYVAKLHNEELHLLVRDEIQSVQDLAGKRVSFGSLGSGTYITASILFGALKVGVQPLMIDQALAMEKLKSGKIDGLVYVVGKPARLFSELAPEDGLKLLPLPLPPKLLETYLPSRLTSEDYPNLIAPDEPLQTIGVGSVLAVYNWGPENWRYTKVERFTKALFDNFEALQGTNRHPKWAEVNLAAELPGWERFAPAERWLEEHNRERPVAVAENELLLEFQRFLQQSNLGEAPASQASKDALFEEFERWMSATRN
ncbi:MAG: TAXI family TRAP transporter solute-binding subunit [Kiloniellales bacterium]|nr:TAXI family TRAP transporter solute-binding subunit [Kiloniellales bacterium]MDJ0969575.1 TAXI family TRAP transporter solute-binding subunit [Kiloniellales bacterium]MDJ0983512.1 TAXI family TRAP transporter solute-binding subunit [Kiloniellales bacterium]